MTWSPADFIAAAQLVITLGIFPVLHFLGRITRRAEQLEQRIQRIEISMASGFAELRAYHLLGKQKENA